MTAVLVMNCTQDLIGRQVLCRWATPMGLFILGQWGLEDSDHPVMVKKYCQLDWIQR